MMEKFWKVQLDVRYLGGHLNFTRRARDGTLSNRVRDAAVGVAAVGALPLGFQVKLKLHMFPPLLFVSFGRPLLGALLLFLACSMGRKVLILLSILSGLGFA